MHRRVRGATRGRDHAAAYESHELPRAWVHGRMHVCMCSQPGAGIDSATAIFYLFVIACQKCHSKKPPISSTSSTPNVKVSGSDPQCRFFGRHDTSSPQNRRKTNASTSKSAMLDWRKMHGIHILGWETGSRHDQRMPSHADVILWVADALDHGSTRFKSKYISSENCSAVVLASAMSRQLAIECRDGP